MKQEDINLALVDAINGIEPALIEEAAEPKTHPLQRRWVRVAAIAAALAILFTALTFWPSGGEDGYITAPGLLTIRAYGAENEDGIPVEGVVLEKGVRLEMTNWSGLSNQAIGVPISLSMPEDMYKGKEISFDITLTGGSWYKDAPLWDENGERLTLYECQKASYYEQHCVFENNTRICFRAFQLSFDNETQSVEFKSTEAKQVFANIIIYADEHIVGYAVIAFYAGGDLETILTDLRFQAALEEFGPWTLIWAWVNAELLETKCFPLRNGRFQKVSKEYVQAQFERIQAENTVE